MIRRLTWLCLSLSFSLIAATPAWAQLDKVFGAKGIPASGTVTAMTPNTITIDIGGTAREIQVNDVAKVTYGDEPAELSKARDQVLNGQIEQAIEDLKTLKPETLTRDVVKQDVEFLRAICMAKMALAGGGNPQAADAALLEFVKNNRGSYHVYEATEMLGNLAVAQGNYDDAAKRYGFLARAPWPDYQLRATVNEARALTAQKKFDEALAKYEAIVKSPETTPEANRQKLFATIGKAVCQAETGAPDEGIKLLEAIIRDNDSQKEPALFARAYNAMGVCQSRANRPKEALMAYLRVDLLFNLDGEAHAEALYNLSKLWSDVNKSDRAVAARNLLKERYAGSPWAKMQ